MTLELLDVVRGWSISAVIVAFIAIGFTSWLPEKAVKAQRTIGIGAGIIGGCAGLLIFILLSFVQGWDDYFAAKATGQEHGEYRGRHQTAARVIRVLGEMDASALGVVFGVLGLILLWFSHHTFRREKAGR